MPTYRYECAKCSRILEDFHAISDPPLTRCPECGGRLKRLIGGGAGVILKGSGFHKTDYRKKHAGDDGASKAEGTKPTEKGGS
jgi:putative FmdB family regulatory protein